MIDILYVILSATFIPIHITARQTSIHDILVKQSLQIVIRIEISAIFFELKRQHVDFYVTTREKCGQVGAQQKSIGSSQVYVIDPQTVQAVNG